jgi:hypothetical protein
MEYFDALPTPLHVHFSGVVEIWDLYHNEDVAEQNKYYINVYRPHALTNSI